jgi:hypothetical protein
MQICVTWHKAMVCMNQINNNPSALSNAVGMSGLSTYVAIHCKYISIATNFGHPPHDLQDTLEVHKESIPNCCTKLSVG